jgi:hypothetical protein
MWNLESGNWNPKSAIRNPQSAIPHLQPKNWMAEKKQETKTGLLFSTLFSSFGICQALAFPVGFFSSPVFQRMAEWLQHFPDLPAGRIYRL